MSPLDAPSAAISMIRARFANRASIVPERVQDSNMSRSPRRNFNGGKYVRPVNHISVIYSGIHLTLSRFTFGDLRARSDESGPLRTLGGTAV